MTDVYLTACSKKSAAAAAACVDPAFKTFLDKLQQKLQLNIHPFIFHVEDEKMTAAKKKAQKALQVRWHEMMERQFEDEQISGELRE